jgi:hypothetical protein
MGMRIVLHSLLIVSLAALAACQKENKPAGNSAAQAPSGLPASGAGGGAPTGGMPSGMPGVHGGGDPHAGMNMNDPHAGMNMDNPHGGGMQGTMPAPGPLDPNTVLEGTIEASPAVAGKIKPGDVLFISAKAVNPATGEILRAPLAVDRIEIAQLPQRFALSNQNAMSAGTKLSGPVAITVRIDRDQDAMTRAPGDLEGILKTQPPAKDLKVVIDTEIQ